ncbi:MAG: hypothetical protein DBY18_00150 [Clostridia bacterium]|nr:MAG: hypothetical protein DBY18_00150 [Clostridia bacterium]
MTTIEKVAYLKGLFEGMEIDESTKEGKLLKAVVEVLGELAEDHADLEDYVAELTEQVDAVDEDLSSLEDVVYEELDDECDGDCEGCDGCDDWDDDLYDVTCPSCKESFEVDEETLLDGGVDCPNCGEHLEFDIEDDEDEDETED